LATIYLKEKLKLSFKKEHEKREKFSRKYGKDLPFLNADDMKAPVPTITIQGVNLTEALTEEKA